jgi:hypothetical protein
MFVVLNGTRSAFAEIVDLRTDEGMICRKMQADQWLILRHCGSDAEYDNEIEPLTHAGIVEQFISGGQEKVAWS